jgi:aromatic-L-amino-acid decarboxylase
MCASGPSGNPRPNPRRRTSASPCPAPEAIFADFERYVLPFNKGNIHPRFWAWVQGTGTPLGMLADLLASGMNSNMGIGDHAPMYVEQQVLDWCKELMGYPAEAGGMLVSGGTVANLTALTVARNTFDERIRLEGLRALPGQLVVYASEETHSCQIKSVELLGLGREALRKVPVDAAYRMNLHALRAQIAADRAAGYLPLAVVGNAGTVNTGAIDPLDELSEFCRQERIWFHVDGAFGALAKLVPDYAPSLRAIEQADSLAFDLHKWPCINYEVGCTLIRDARLHRAAFALQPNYLLSHERGLAAGPEPAGQYGIELSRGFKALKVWMSFREHGVERYARLIAQNLSQCQYLARLIDAEPLLERLAPVSLNIVCYRFHPGGATDDDALNSLNRELLMRLQEAGIAAPSSTVLGGRYAIRVENVNHRSCRDDFDVLVRETLRLGREITAERVALNPTNRP